jgi:hypothetical protein
MHLSEYRQPSGKFNAPEGMSEVDALRADRDDWKMRFYRDANKYHGLEAENVRLRSAADAAASLAQARLAALDHQRERAERWKARAEKLGWKARAEKLGWKARAKKLGWKKRSEQ